MAFRLTSLVFQNFQALNLFNSISWSYQIIEVYCFKYLTFHMHNKNIKRNNKQEKGTYIFYDLLKIA